jgi:hypothetical protein
VSGQRSPSHGVTAGADRGDDIRSPRVDWPMLLNPTTWLGHVTPDEFLGVSGRDVFGVVPQNEVDTCFTQRRVDAGNEPRSSITTLLDADVQCITHALSALLSMSCDDANRLMPPPIRGVVGSQNVVFDHIGIEVFGKLEWYIELFDRAYAPLGINVVHEHIFPSVQVRRALEYDPELGEVRIGRIYFAHGNTQVNLEVFEATQRWHYIALRQACLYAHLSMPPGRAHAFHAIVESAESMPEPVGHVAFRVESAQTVRDIQDVLLRESRIGGAATMRPYSKRVFFNPSDGSTNTKFVVSTQLPDGRRLDSQIVEIVSYGE